MCIPNNNNHHLRSVFMLKTVSEGNGTKMGALCILRTGRNIKILRNKGLKELSALVIALQDMEDTLESHLA